MDNVITYLQDYKTRLGLSELTVTWVREFSTLNGAYTSDTNEKIRIIFMPRISNVKEYLRENAFKFKNVEEAIYFYIEKYKISAPLKNEVVKKFKNNAKSIEAELKLKRFIKRFSSLEEMIVFLNKSSKDKCFNRFFSISAIMCSDEFYPYGDKTVGVISTASRSIISEEVKFKLYTSKSLVWYARNNPDIFGSEDNTLMSIYNQLRRFEVKNDGIIYKVLQNVSENSSYATSYLVKKQYSVDVLSQINPHNILEYVNTSLINSFAYTSSLCSYYNDGAHKLLSMLEALTGEFAEKDGSVSPFFCKTFVDKV